MGSIRAQSIATIANVPKMHESGGTMDGWFHAHSRMTLLIIEGLNF